MSCLACGACSLAGSCCGGILNATMPSITRLGHILTIALTLLIATILGKDYPNDINGYKSYTKVELTSDCSDPYEEDCIFRQLVYRATFALFLMFVILAVTSGFSETANKGFWPMKFFAPVALFIGFWWGENDFFSGWSEFTRVLSFFWLLVQSFLLFDFAHDLHEVIMQKANDADAADDGTAKRWKIFYIVLCGGFVAATVTGLVFLFQDYADCDLGAFFISVTLVSGVITTAISLLDVVRKGFLTPMIMFSYSTFICWYALLSSPEEGCNPTYDNNGGNKQKTALTVVIVVTIVVLLYCSYFGTIILNAFSPEGESAMQYGNKASAGSNSPQLNDVLTTDTRGAGDEAESGKGSFNHHNSVAADSSEESSGTPYERVFFHVLMVLLVCYCNMILTDWGKSNGAPDGYGSDRVGAESMWLKILSQWVFIVLQCRALWVAYQDNVE